MFEQYISDWLTSYLGHFLDIKRENLRANILSAFSEPAGLTLKNVKLKTEALDFFQLPVAVEEAVVGSLHVRCPWGFRGRNVIELSDVFVCVSPRPEADWEEAPAKRRAYATKRVQLSAAEASRQLTGASSGQKSGYGWSFLTWSGSILLNKLQFRMKRTHICFKVRDACGQGKDTEFGMHLGLVETGYDDQKIKIKMKESGMKDQISDITRMQDQYTVWNLHNQYAVLRPTGWRSDAASAVTPRRLWQYAIQAVLQDLGQHHPRKLTGATLLEWREQRQRYVELWSHHLQSTKGSLDQAKQEQEQAQIEALEMKLLVPDILLFRHLASRALKRRPNQQGSHTPLLSESSSAAASKDSGVQVLLEAAKELGSPKEAGSPKEDESKEADSPPGSSTATAVSDHRQGWWTWGMSGVSSILGYVPSKEHLQAPPLRPSQAEMQELFATLSLDPHNLPDGRDPSRKLEVIADVKIASGSVTFSDAIKGAHAKQLASIDVEQLKVYVQLRSEATHAKMTVQEITVQDLSTGAADCADVVLARWQQPDDSPKLEVWVQALHVTHRPTCWAALSALTAAGPGDTQSSRMADTANLLNDSKAQTLAQAQRAIKAFMLPTVAIWVEDVVASMSQHGQSASESCSIMHTGAIQITHQPGDGQLVQQQHLIQQLQLHCTQQKSLSKEVLQELLMQVQTKVLYQRLCITLDAVRLSTANRSSSLSSSGTTVLSPCRCTAYLDLHRAPGDALLPQLKALVELDGVQVHLTQAFMATLQSSLLQSSGPADVEQLHSATEQTGQPLAEVNVTAGIVSMAFDDHQSQDADARNTHLKLRGQKLNLLVEVMQDAIATKATLLQLHASDRSQYISRNPKIYGTYSVPRLAQVMGIDSLTVRVDHSRANGLLVSGRLMGATAKGWPGESGSMISRLTSKTPAQAEFTVYNTVDHLQTSITLQDGCFGTATLMRIAALFMPSPTPASLTTSETFADSVAATVVDSDRPSFGQHAKSNLTSFGTDGSKAQAGNESAFGLTSVPESCPQGVSLESEPAELLHNSQTTEVPRSPLPDAPESSCVDLGPELPDGVQHQAEQELAEPAANGLLADAASAEDTPIKNSRSSLLEANRSSADDPEAHAPVRDALGHTDLPSHSSPMMLSADQGLLSAIETPLSGANHAAQAEKQAASTAVSAMALEGVTTTSTLPVEEQAEGMPAGTAEADRFTPRPSDPEEEVEPNLERKEQFSLEIVRCKIVCPAKVDTNTFSDADPSPLDHTLYMEIPHFLLQLPVSQPAQHPRPHPVDLNVRHVLNRQQPAVPAPDAVAPSPFASSDQQGTIFSMTNITLYVALPEEFDLPESVTTSSEAQTQLPPFLSIPTASLIAVPPRPPPQHAFLHRQLPQHDVPTFELEMKTAEVTAKPKQLQTISASTIRYSTEMDNILGKSASNPPAPVPAATADSLLQPNPPIASSNRDHPTDQPPSQQASRAEAYPGFAVEASVGLVSLQLHSSSAKLPALVLQWQRLSGHYAQAAGQQQATACGLTWHYLALHLTENPAEPCQQLSLEHVGMLRSGSLLLPGRISRVHSEPLGSHGAPSSSRSSHHGGSGRLTRGLSTRHHMTAARTISAEEELLSHQHSLSRLHVGPLGNGRSGLGGLTGLAEIAADDDGSTPSSPQYIFNNRARLASDSFNEMLEGILPSLSALSLQKAANQQHDNSDNGSSSVSGSHSHRRHRLDRLKSMGRATSVASSTISVEELQRQVPVIRHRSVFMNPTPPAPYADAPNFPDFASAASSFDLSSAPSVSSRQALTVYHDAQDRLGSSPDVDMPTSPGGTPLAEGWSPDMLPAGDRLLLLLGSKECFAASDGIASSSTDASIGCSLLHAANNADIRLQSALEICASDMMLRVYLEGWQLLIHTSYESIEAVLKGQQQPHQQASSTQPSQHDPNQLARSRSMGSLAAAAQGLSIQLHATEVVAELVGNIFPGENTLSPCISVSTAITIDSHTAGGQLQHCLAVPRLAVATALMELPPDIRSMVSRFEGGVLIGALGFLATLTLPIVASGSSPPAEDGLLFQLEEHTPHSQQQLKAPVLAVDLQLSQLCIYASQRRLCITAALVKAFQEVQEGLLLAARPRTTTLPVEVAPTPKECGSHTYVLYPAGGEHAQL
ncbi:MAG: vacuolar sorting-associated 13F-like [Trebouxia sp. A1-2]|nr:MAG: vacuolar sorting-associated 13F-like [Trebouxia sp. A1-2]